VAVPNETIWPLEPHTSAKHQILRKYLDAWLPILGTYNKRIVYIDGFSGPGRYKGGEPGSPIVALQAALAHQAKLPGELVFLFIEKDNARADFLTAEIAKLRLTNAFKVRVERGEFADKLGSLLDALDSTSSQIAPTFALIDPFGFSGFPYALIQRLLSKNKCEVLVTVMVDSVNRWLEHPRETIKAHIVDTFGTVESIKIAEGTGDRVAELKNLYHRQLNKAAKFVRYFEMRDHDGRLVYYLFFASNNALGHLKMKEAMWKVDPLGEFSFSDSTDPNQPLLFAFEPSMKLLAADIAEKFRSSGQVPIKLVEAHVQDCTAYLRKHMGKALQQLEADGKLKVAESKTDGKKRRAKSFPNEALITF
jgi:three-Cys-motif partner protein